MRTGKEFEDSIKFDKNNHNKRIVSTNTKFYEPLDLQGLYSLAQMIEFHKIDDIKDEEARKEHFTERQALVCYDSDVAPVTEQRVNQLKKYIAVGMNNPWACGGLGNEVNCFFIRGRSYMVFYLLKLGRKTQLERVQKELKTPNN